MRAALVPAFGRWQDMAWDRKQRQEFAIKVISRWGNKSLWYAWQQWLDCFRSREQYIGALGKDMYAYVQPVRAQASFGEHYSHEYCSGLMINSRPLLLPPACPY